MELYGMPAFVLSVFLTNCAHGQISHPVRAMIKPAGKTVIIKCSVPEASLQSSPLHLYRRTANGFQRIMHFATGSKFATNDNNIPSRLTGSIKNNDVSLTISSLSNDDAGWYYCAMWSGDTHCSLRQEIISKNSKKNRS